MCSCDEKIFLSFCGRCVGIVSLSTLKMHSHNALKVHYQLSAK